MKTLLLFLIAVIPIIYATTDQMPNLRQHSEECVMVTGVHPDVLAKAKKGIFTEDEALKRFTLCYFQRAGVLDNMGLLDVEKVVSSLPHNADKAEVRRTLELCKPEEGKDVADNAFKLFKCCRKESPGNISLE